VEHDSVLALIAKVLEVDLSQINLQTKSGDLAAWDSLGTMNILLELESVYGLQLDPGKAQKLESVEGILSLLREAKKLP
jgi:acyl carrier protein